MNSETAAPKRDYSRHIGVGLILIAAIILLLLSVRPFGNQMEPSRLTTVAADIQSLNAQLKLYRSMNGFFPTTEQGLQALVKPPTTEPVPSRWIQLYQEVPRDPWHQPYVYRCPGIKHPESYDLFSAGPDRRPDTKDDVWGQ